MHVITCAGNPLGAEMYVHFDINKTWSMHRKHNPPPPHPHLDWNAPAFVLIRTLQQESFLTCI